jgi:transposase
MPVGRTVFAQVMDLIPRRAFDRCVARYPSQRRLRTFSCYDQFLCLAFAQLTYRESLRDIETCLRALQPKLYHAGLRGRVARSTLADANETRDWRIYADFAQTLIHRARALYCDEPFAVELAQTAYAFDATTIDLCLALFPWASFRRHKAAVKLHTLLDLRTQIPTFVAITPGTTAEVTLLDALAVEPGAFYVVDRGYTDFGRLYRLTQGLAFFVIRGKRGLDYARRVSRAVDTTTGLRSDQTITLCGPKTATRYPDALRRITFVDSATTQRFVFLTNNFTLPPLQIAQLYQCRWQVELFFKWIKQHLRIKAFYGTSENAVKTQVWIAISVYVLVALLKKDLRLDHSLYEILQILSVTLFERVPLHQALARMPVPDSMCESCNQLPLFDL